MLKFSKRLIDISGMRSVVQRRVPVLTLDSRRPGPRVSAGRRFHRGA
jgi:hypothetical protein